MVYTWKEFPETAKDSLPKIVASAPWLNKNIRLKDFTIHFPKLSSATESGATTVVLKKNAKGIWYTDTNISEYLV